MTTVVRSDPLVPWSLGLTALAFLGFGGWLLVQPEGLEMLGLALTTAAAVTEVRAFYGGLELGCGLFFALAVTRPAWHRPALVLQATSLGLTATARGLGIVVDGTRQGLVFGLLSAEAVAAALAVWLLWRGRRSPVG